MLKIITNLSIIAIIISSVFIANGLILAWTSPSASPPDNNADAPLNVSSDSQYKSGALGVGGVFRGYSNAIFDGNVGIGTASPTQKLDVVGYIKGQSGVCIGSDCRNSWPGASEITTAGNWNIGVISGGTNTTVWTKLGELRLYRSGTVRTRIKIQVNDNRLYAQIRRNGVAVGAQREAITGQTLYWNEDISGWSSGDSLELWVRMASGGSGSSQVAVGVSNPLADVVKYISEYD